MYFACHMTLLSDFQAQAPSDAIVAKDFVWSESGPAVLDLRIKPRLV